MSHPITPTNRNGATDSASPTFNDRMASILSPPPRALDIGSPRLPPNTPNGTRQVRPTSPHGAGDAPTPTSPPYGRSPNALKHANYTWHINAPGSPNSTTPHEETLSPHALGKLNHSQDHCKDREPTAIHDLESVQYGVTLDSEDEGLVGASDASRLPRHLSAASDGEAGPTVALDDALADVTNRFCSATQAVVTAAGVLSDAADEAVSNSATVRVVVGMMAVSALGFAIVTVFDIDNTARAAFAGAAVAAVAVSIILVAILWVLGLEERWSAAKLASRAVNQILDDEVLVLRSRGRGNRAWMGLARLVQDITNGKVDGRYVKSVVLPKDDRLSWDEVRLIGRMASTTRMRLREAETTFGDQLAWPQARKAYKADV